MTKDKILLIVDDSRIARMMITQIVTDKEPEWSILEADSGDEALRICDEIDTQIDLFSIDLNMPGMDGLDLIERLKPRYPNAQMALLTANIQDVTQDRCKQLDVPCVTKPVTEESIAQMLKGFR